MKVEIGPVENDGQKVNIELHDYDTWNVDVTLAHIIVPLLKQLKEECHGYPDVLGSIETWYDVLDKMIFSFESKLHDWESEFYSGEVDIQWGENDDGTYTMGYGDGHTFEIDYEGLEAYQKRIDEGFMLFGKYYNNLWD